MRRRRRRTLQQNLLSFPYPPAVILSAFVALVVSGSSPLLAIGLFVLFLWFWAFIFVPRCDGYVVAAQHADMQWLESSCASGVVCDVLKPAGLEARVVFDVWLNDSVVKLYDGKKNHRLYSCPVHPHDDGCSSTHLQNRIKNSDSSIQISLVASPSWFYWWTTLNWERLTIPTDLVPPCTGNMSLETWIAFWDACHVHLVECNKQRFIWTTLLRITPLYLIVIEYLYSGTLQNNNSPEYSFVSKFFVQLQLFLPIALFWYGGLLPQLQKMHATLYKAHRFCEVQSLEWRPQYGLNLELRMGVDDTVWISIHPWRSCHCSEEDAEEVGSTKKYLTLTEMR